MKSLKRVIAVLVIMLTLGLACMPAAAASKEKAAKISKTATYRNNKEQCTIWGKTAAGKVVWKYKCTKRRAAELSGVSFITYKNYVYLIDGRTFIKLNKQNGKKLLTKKNLFPEIQGSAAMCVDKNGNLYVTGFYSDTIYKISPKGKMIWSRRVKNECYWPSKIKYSKNKLTVCYDGNNSPDVVINANSGRIIKYK